MIAKRVFDLVSSVIGLVVLAPILVLVSLFVWLGDRGPVFFRQERVGRGGRLFRIHKFRTMRVASSGSQVTSADDDRRRGAPGWRPGAVRTWLPTRPRRSSPRTWVTEWSAPRCSPTGSPRAAPPSPWPSGRGTKRSNLF